jgi:hypothetical protein
MVNGPRGTCRRRCEQGGLVTADFEERSPSAGDREPAPVVEELGGGQRSGGRAGQAEMRCRDSTRQTKPPLYFRANSLSG